MKSLVLAEKPSVARDIARVLGCHKNISGAIEGSNYIVTWALGLYLIVDTILVMLYCAIWIICFKKNSVFRALALSIIPSMLFLFSGIMSRSVLLIIASVLFAPSHIVISYKNVK